MKQKIINFILNLIRTNSNESSKRFLAIYGTLFLQSYVVFFYTTDENSSWILMELVCFVLVISGVAVYERKNTK